MSAAGAAQDGSEAEVQRVRESMAAAGNCWAPDVRNEAAASMQISKRPVSGIEPSAKRLHRALQIAAAEHASSRRMQALSETHTGVTEQNAARATRRLGQTQRDEECERWDAGIRGADAAVDSELKAADAAASVGWQRGRPLLPSPAAPHAAAPHAQSHAAAIPHLATHTTFPLLIPHRTLTLTLALLHPLIACVLPASA